MDPLDPYQQFGYPSGAPYPGPHRDINQMRRAEGFGADGYRQKLQGDAQVYGNGISEEDANKAAKIMQRLIVLMQNTNFTAALPAFNEPHFWSQPIDLSTTYTLAGAVTSAYQTALSFIVPDSRAARISEYGFNVRGGAFTYNGDISWQITYNGNPVPGLENITQQRGTIVLPAKTFIRSEMDQKDLIEFKVRRVVAAGSPDDIDLVLRGWTWRPLRPETDPALGLAL